MLSGARRTSLRASAATAPTAAVKCSALPIIGIARPSAQALLWSERDPTLGSPALRGRAGDTPRSLDRSRLDLLWVEAAVAT